MVRIEFDVEKAYEKYKKAGSGKTIALELGIHYVTLLNRFKENNLPLFNSKSVNLNHYYFEKIDTADKAYFLGLLLADGCVHKNRIIIYLQERDKDILEKFKEALNYNGDLRFVKRNKENHQNQICLEFSSKIMFNRLITLGCFPNKSNTLNKIPAISENLKKYLILGYFDGDGTIGKDKRSNAPVFSIVGNKEFLEDIRTVLDKEIFRASGNISECALKGKYTLDYKSKRSFFELYDYFYSEKSVYLERKYNKFVKIRNSLKTSNNSSKKIRQYDLEDNFIQEFNSIKEVKNKFNLKSVDKILKCMRGVNNSSIGYKWKAIDYGCK